MHGNSKTIPATADGRDLSTEATFDVINPATGRAFAKAPAVTPEQLDEVFAAANRAFRTWRVDESKRRDALRNAASVMIKNADELALIHTAEHGKPLRLARQDFVVAAEWMSYYADLEVPREVIRDDDFGYEEVFRRPLGVVSAITPWNAPILLAVWKIAPALRAGNTMVLKPSPYTPLATLALGRLLRDVFPPGVINIVTGLDPLGATMVSHPLTRKVSFTGSTAVGKLVCVAAADDLKRVSLELGGNDPAIVLGDVDVHAIAEDLFWGAFRNNGQVCLAVKRVYAHESIQPQLVEALSEIARAVRVDDGMVADVQLGPLNNRPQFDRIASLVSDTVSNGGRIAAGGRALDRDGYFFAPTIVDNISDGFRIVDEEQFGPVLPIVSYRTEAEAIDLANRGEYGLTASVWSSDTDHAAAIAEQIDSGQVSINAHGTGVQKHLPFGGHKWSGVGVENGPWGLYSFTELQVLTGPSRIAVATAHRRTAVSATQSAYTSSMNATSSNH